ncbi:hypothetical protein OE88DRAFT_1663457 [Heliocybe sulcata]|uniref:WW domain-containing protein n=1 Tax=Heliocybe sulcata TaxID=5364 RepID=A0A5C3MW31_9AGAM|nr:hypothetical protein OE88DRAFT_1663457 [Heliocybe sulcata]
MARYAIPALIALASLLKRLAGSTEALSRALIRAVRWLFSALIRRDRGHGTLDDPSSGDVGTRHDSTRDALTILRPTSRAETRASIVYGSTVPQIGPLIRPTPQSSLLSPALSPAQQDMLQASPDAIELSRLSRILEGDSASIRSQWTSREGTSLQHSRGLDSRRVSRSPSPMSSRVPSPTPSHKVSLHDAYTFHRSHSDLGVPHLARVPSPCRSRGGSVRSSTVAPCSPSEITATRDVLSTALPGGYCASVGSNDYPTLTPIHPEQVPRYWRNHKISKTTKTFDMIPRREAYTFRDRLPGLPEEWIPEIHPEGALYFHHRHKNIFTETDLTDPKKLQFIEACIDALNAKMDPKDLAGDSIEDTELVLEPLKKGDADPEHTICGYYFVDRLKRTLFWFDDYDIEKMMTEVQAVSTYHLAYELEAQFWKHCEMFPNHRPYEEDLVKELRGIVLHGGIDTATSSYSTVPYSPQEMERILSFLKHAEAGDSCQKYIACTVSRLMGIFVHARYLHFHGTPMARLARNQNVYEECTRTTSKPFWFLSCLLFYAPRKHLDLLDKMWVDKMINYVSWSRFMEQLLDEWSDLSLTTTVMLTVDISFLAIQSVDVASQKAGSRGAAQIPIYLSTVASAGSIIIGLLLTRQHRIISRDDADVAQKYLWDKFHPRWGFEVLAILYSIPFALLMWAMVTFLIGLSFVCFSVNTTFADTDLRVHLPPIFAWVFVLGLILVYLHTEWEGDEEASLLTSLGTYPGRICSSIWSHIAGKARLVLATAGEVMRKYGQSQENEGSTRAEGAEEP